MRKSMSLLFCIIVLFANYSNAQKNDKEPIRELIQEWVEVTNNEDIEGLMKILTDDVKIFSPNSEPIMDKSSAKETYTSYYKSYDLELNASVREIQVSANIAYVWVYVEGNRTLRESNEMDNFTYNNLWVLKKDQSTWKIWRAMFNSPS